MKFFSLTGKAGTGKSTLFTHVLLMLSLKGISVEFIRSITTRKPRLNDPPFEYIYAHPNSYKELLDAGKVIYPFTLADVQYATLLSDISLISNNPKAIGVKIFTPDGVKFFKEYFQGQLYSFYIVAPSENILKQRLISRGDNVETINQRLEIEKTWDNEARQSDLFDEFITNEADINTTAQLVANRIKSLITRS